MVCEVQGLGMCVCVFVVFQAEDGIRDLVRSRGLGDVYKRQHFRRRVRHRAVDAKEIRGGTQMDRGG